MPTPATPIPMLLHFAVLFSSEELVTVTEGAPKGLPKSIPKPFAGLILLLLLLARQHSRVIPDRSEGESNPTKKPAAIA